MQAMIDIEGQLKFQKKILLLIAIGMLLIQLGFSIFTSVFKNRKEETPKESTQYEVCLNGMKDFSEKYISKSLLVNANKLGFSPNFSDIKLIKKISNSKCQIIYQDSKGQRNFIATIKQKKIINLKELKPTRTISI